MLAVDSSEGQGAEWKRKYEFLVICCWTYFVIQGCKIKHYEHENDQWRNHQKRVDKMFDEFKIKTCAQTHILIYLIRRRSVPTKEISSSQFKAKFLHLIPPNDICVDDATAIRLFTLALLIQLELSKFTQRCFPVRKRKMVLFAIMSFNDIGNFQMVDIFDWFWRIKRLNVLLDESVKFFLLGDMVGLVE